MSISSDVVAMTDGGPPDVLADSESRPLPPLTISALMVTKADLIAALRVYLPHLSDVEAIDGDRFLLSVGPHANDAPENGAR